MMPLSVPKDINKYFFNREKDITRISLITSSIYQDLPSQLLITGQRGVGKTFLLKKVLDDQKDEFSLFLLIFQKFIQNLEVILARN